MVVQPREEREWPETVVLDDTWFDVVDRRTGDRSRAFHILGVYGYSAGGAKGRVWALYATPQVSQSDWKQLLGTLPGDPTLAGFSWPTRPRS
ncbi:hypothetical protein ER308_04585 [Egibacter rhizosphaerae]|uniref:Transposase IS701-like DDE domain-containing protein n=1 Tax=Egibacter rhizosphaerae TaxID=1670831 RepID=A0A411YCB7_9ACTN|nr:hypothetical protein [Egibacter rhizosphaerae]QBI18893.1 hypothetical protein ER308_04585 [Egibacter rhizosphaerae]